jgi:hypothetical protein
MTPANLTENLLNKLQILPLHRQQQLLDGLEDEELLTNISTAELLALATVSLAPDQQAQLSDLLARNAESSISPAEIILLDQLLEQVDQLNILKARAKYTLQHLSRSITA